MRPKELLGMVEEASWALMSEGRKDKAKMATGKREKRVNEITTLPADGITPKSDTLHAKRHIHAILKRPAPNLSDSHASCARVNGPRTEPSHTQGAQIAERGHGVDRRAS